LAHIEDLLDHMGDTQLSYLTLIKNIRNEVFEQEILSEYWNRKLELIDDLGLL